MRKEKKKIACSSKSIPSSSAKFGFVFDTNAYSLSSSIQLYPNPILEMMDKINPLKIREIE